MQNASLRCEREALERKLRKAQEQVDSTSSTVLFLSKQVKEKEGKVKEAAFSVDNMKGSNKWVRFYTGFDSITKFDAFLHFVTQDPGVCSGKIRGNIARGRLDAGPHSTLSHADQLLLVMCRLRLGLLLQDLAYRFRISETTVSRVWLNWTEVIQTRLMQIPVTCSPKYVQAFEPKRKLQHRGGDALTLLDCTDLFFEAQSKERTPATGPWRQPYRNHYVRRGYALVAPSGYLTFASGTALGDGSTAAEDEEEEEEEDEEEGAEAAAGGGGGGERGLAGLKLPTFFTDGALTEEQRGLSRQVLSIRSHVDKVLNFRFLKCVYPRTMESQVDRAWTICSYLACLLHEPMGLR
ncbi:uncharacterized protein LOC119960800 [Scyliorhinus canicula]|uniref:uncharacterized protein LOC119960800 n=1 Tax=Scyliorhinus canicula TaxID=7830 RepID=UPI0018F4F19C|nr:uncharacterized protein LOC119960800 [Scyliorhinus canicula]